MLEKRTTIVLSVIAASLLAFILIFERGTLSSSDLAGRRGHVLTRFVRDQVTQVELVRGEEEAIVLEREPLEDDAEEGAIADFRLAAPVDARADQDAVGSFLGALEWLMATRTLDGITDEDRARYGLSAPRFVVRFRVAGEQVALRVGGEAPEGQGIYVGVEGQDRAYVVGADFLESIDHDLAHFRDKALFPRDFYATDARAIRVGGEVTVAFAKEGETWLVSEPVRGWANRGAVDRLKRLASEATVARFVTEEASELGRYGLDRPWRDLTITRPDDARGQKSGRLRVGAVCGEHTDERYALVADGGPVVCVLSSALDALTLEESTLRESRLLPLSADAVEGLVLEGAGGRLELRREDSEWQRVREGEAPVPADDGAIAEWLGALRDSRAVGFEDIAGDAPGRGLGAPAATLTIRRSDADEELVLRLGESGPEGAWVRRGEEAALARFEAPVAELLAATALRFRDRALVPEEAASAQAITIRRGGIEERAVRGEGGTWRLEAPIVAEADRVVVRELARQVADLRAERFVAERALAEHGLGAPAQTIAVRFADEGEAARTVTLRIGAPAEGGAFAQLEGDEAVFVLGQAALEGLEGSLVSLDLLTIDTSEAQSIRIERGGAVVADLRREGTVWQTASGAPAHADRTQALLERLSTLRASGVLRYADAPLSPATRITVTSSSGSTTLEVGDSESDSGAPIRRSDVGVIYEIRADLVSVLRTYVP